MHILVNNPYITRTCVQRKQTTEGGWGACNKMADVINKKQDGAGQEVNINSDTMKMKVAKVDENSEWILCFDKSTRMLN